MKMVWCHCWGSEPIWLMSGQALGGIEHVGVCEEVDQSRCVSAHGGCGA